MTLEVLVNKEGEFDKNLYEGVVYGLKAYLEDKKIDYVILEKELDVPHEFASMDEKGRLILDDVLKEILWKKIDNKEGNKWEFLLTKSPLFLKERNEEVIAFFRDLIGVNRTDLATCVISEVYLWDVYPGLNFARGVVTAYHELYAHSGNADGHCDKPDCIRYTSNGLEGIDYHAKLWMKNKKIPTCESHKIA